jgi:hypothetical protein
MQPIPNNRVNAIRADEDNCGDPVASFQDGGGVVESDAVRAGSDTVWREFL